jgi:hypothetical protein
VILTGIYSRGPHDSHLAATGPRIATHHWAPPQRERQVGECGRSSVATSARRTARQQLMDGMNDYTTSSLAAERVVVTADCLAARHAEEETGQVIRHGWQVARESGHETCQASLYLTVTHTPAAAATESGNRGLMSWRRRPRSK